MVDKNHNPARNEGESHESYRSRRRNGNQAIRLYLNSRFGEQVRWLSQFQGKYLKKDGPLMEPQEAVNLIKQIQRAGLHEDGPSIEKDSVNSEASTVQLAEEVPLGTPTTKP